MNKLDYPVNIWPGRGASQRPPTMGVPADLPKVKPGGNKWASLGPPIGIDWASGREIIGNYRNIKVFLFDNY